MRILSLCVLAAGALCAQESYSAMEWAREREANRQYTDLRLTLLQLPTRGSFTTESEQPGAAAPPPSFANPRAVNDSETLTLQGGTPASRLSLGVRTSSGDDLGAGVLQVGIDVGYQSIDISSGGEVHRGTTGIRSGIAGFDMAYAVRPFGWNPIQAEIGVLAGAGLSRFARERVAVQTPDNGDPALVTFVRDGNWGWAYEVGARAGITWRVVGGWLVTTDIRWLYFQTSADGKYDDAAFGRTEYRDTLTLNGLAWSIGSGWRF